MRPKIALALAGLLLGALPATARPAAAQTAASPATGPRGEAAYTAVLERVAAWRSEHPDLVQHVDIGRSTAGRPLFALRISAADDGTVPEIYLGGGIHGHEGSERDALFLVDQLLARRDRPQIRQLLETRALLVQPLINPDGVVAHTRHNARAVDLNRNFGGRWQPGKKARSNPGPAAFSEPESRAVRDFLRERPQLRTFVDMHRSTALLIVASTDDPARDATLTESGNALARAMGGTHAERGARRFDRLRGLAADWAANALGITGYAWENPWADHSGPVDDDPRWRGLLHLLERLDQLPPPPARFDIDSAWNEVAAEFRDACEEHLVVGASLMFVRGAEVLGFETFGHADQAGDRPVDRDTIYHWASITKTFTGITMMQLRDRGLLSLDDRAVQRLPELRAVHDPDGAWLDALTLRHLLSHSAGFRSSTWPWGGAQPWHPHEPTQYAQLVAMLPYTEIEFEPGSRYQYSNPGIVFLGRTIELLTGDDYEVQVDKNVLRPLGMHRSYFDITPYHLRRHRSHSYQRLDSQLGAKDLGNDFDTGVTVSNGGLNAPLPDMARYLAFLLGAVGPDSNAAQVLARESLEEMWQPLVSTSRDGSEQMGLTFFLQQRGDQCFVTHTGGQRSFITFFYVHPESGTGALGAFNTNTAGPVMATLRRACMDRLSLPLAQQRQGPR